MPGILVHELTLADLDEALGYAHDSLVARTLLNLDTTSTRAWIDTLLDLRLRMG